MHTQFSAALTVALFLPAASATAQGTSPPPGPLTVAEVVQVESAILGETRTLRIGLPASYSAGEERCAVLYMLDGQTLFLQALGSVHHMANRGFPSIIVVGIDNTERARDLTPAGGEAAQLEFPDSGGSLTFRRFLVDELQPYIQENYRTNGMTLLAGHSFGGLFATECLLDEPEAFGGYLILSPSLWWDERSLVQRILDVPADHGLWSRFVYLSMGEEGSRMNAPFEEAVWSLEDRAGASFHWGVGRFEGHDHWAVALPSLNAGLRTFTRPFREAPQGLGTLKELEEAFSALREVYHIDIELSPAAVGRAAYDLSNRGEVDASAALLGQAIERFPKAPRLYYIRGMLLVDAGRFEEAIAGYDEGIARLEGDDELAPFLGFLRQARAGAAAQLEAQGEE